MCADGEGLAVAHVGMRQRQAGHATRVQVLALGDPFHARRIKTVAAHQLQHALRIGCATARAHVVRLQELRLGHPRQHLEFLAQPVAQADVVGMKMGDDHALDRLADQLLCKDLLPAAARFIGGKTAIDDGPAVTVFQQPQVDVIEHKRQRHAQPPHAGRDVDNRAGRRRFGERVMHLRRGGWRFFERYWCAHGVYVTIDVVSLCICF
jgi:hypothetical protein